MSTEVSITGDDSMVLTEDDKSRYLLQYILAARGICHENGLLLALMALQRAHSVDENEGWSATKWLERLADHINRINVKLHPLSYKIVKVSHGMGKNIVTEKSRRTFESFTESNDDRENTYSNLVLPESNRFYVYTNMISSEETKFATRFTQKEIDFVKWTIGQFCNSASEITEGTVPGSSSLVREVDRIRQNAVGNLDSLQSWNKFTSFSLGSTKLLQYEDLNALEIEDLIVRLCDYKWFFRNSQGEVGMDLRCIAELEEYLLSAYELSTCLNCNKLAIQGVMCDNEHDDAISIWHVDCYQHYITHVSKNCNLCETSLITNGVYVI